MLKSIIACVCFLSIIFITLGSILIAYSPCPISIFENHCEYSDYGLTSIFLGISLFVSGIFCCIKRHQFYQIFDETKKNNNHYQPINEINDDYDL